MSANASSRHPVTAVRFPPTLHQSLHDYARLNGMTVSEVIRTAVRLHVGGES